MLCTCTSTAGVQKKTVGIRLSGKLHEVIRVSIVICRLRLAAWPSSLRPASFAKHPSLSQFFVTAHVQLPLNWSEYLVLLAPLLAVFDLCMPISTFSVICGGCLLISTRKRRLRWYQSAFLVPTTERRTPGRARHEFPTLRQWLLHSEKVALKN